MDINQIILTSTPMPEAISLNSPNKPIDALTHEPKLPCLLSVHLSSLQDDLCSLVQPIFCHQPRNRVRYEQPEQRRHQARDT